ncbi:MAG: methionine synthase [Candidatus Altiarchaeota archaeon]|nr:methionine synthase [Candidatus Altiarchaeota archaeon]
MIETTVIGSFPVELDGEVFAGRYFNGRVGDASLDLVRQAVGRQVKAGIDIVSDGQTRGHFVKIFARNFRGIAIEDRPVVYGKVEYARLSSVSYQKFVRKILPKKVKLKGVITGAYTIAMNSENRFYKRAEDLVFDLARGLNREARALDKVVDFIQVDEPFLSVEYPEYAREVVKTVFRGVKKPRMLHVCGDVAGIFDRLVDFPVEILEHEFAANPDLWETVREHKFKQKIGVGVVRSDSNRVETVHEIRKSMLKAIEILGGDKVLFNPDCGLRDFPQDVAFKKLSNMVEARDQIEKEGY